MSSSTDLFKHESLEDPETIIKYLKALLEGFENRSILFDVENQHLLLKPQGLISMEIEAKRKGDLFRLTLKFRWNDSQTQKPNDRKVLNSNPRPRPDL